MNRAAGILLAISSLPSKYGIGCFDEAAYQFVDWLKEAGQTYWQILPVGPTSYGDSPYQSFSTFAGNPYFISLDALIEEGVLTREECDAADFGKKAGDIHCCIRHMSAAISAKMKIITPLFGKMNGGFRIMRCLWQ